MKNITTLLATVLIAVGSIAQAPSKFSYQSVIRSASGNLVTNAGVGMKISILYGSASGPASYSEIYNPNPTTNDNGLLSLQIGSGIALVGQLDTINWSGGSYFLKTETDPTGGTTYSVLGTSELLSVPYALHAANGNWTKTGNDISCANSGNVGIGIPTPQFKLDVTGNSRFTSGVNGYNTAPYLAAVYGESLAPDHDYALYGKSNTSTGIAVYGYAPSGTAGYFSGPVSIDAGNLNISTGMVGIGTASPAYPLDISNTVSSTYATPGGLGLLSYNASGNFGNASATYPWSIYASGYILAQAFVAFSDQRIKKDFSLSDNSKDLITLSNLQVTDYRYIDEVGRGRGLKKGFIAQQVNEVLPEAVLENSDFITDIYANAEHTALTGNTLLLLLKNPHSLCSGDEVRLFTNSGKKDVKVEVQDDYSFAVKNWNSADQNVFVYGKKVKDFLTVDYDRIYTLNVSVTQELIKKVGALEKENAALKQMISSELEHFRSEIEGIKNPAALQVQK